MRIAMIKPKGVYKWKLVDKVTKEIREVGEQQNLVTDSFYQSFIGTKPENDVTVGVFNPDRWKLAIFLSETPLPLPEGEYRDPTVAEANISEAASTEDMEVVWDMPSRTGTVKHNFDPPEGDDRTITILGVYVYNPGKIGLMSFVELTIPIVQSTSYFLYVEYSVSFEYTGGGLNSPDNAFITDWFNEDLERVSALVWGKFHISFVTGHTMFLPPVDKDKVMRCPSFRISYKDAIDSGCNFGHTVTKSFSYEDISGPLGAVVRGRIHIGDSDTLALGYNGPVDRCIGSYNSNEQPSISRIFVHPGDHIDKIFSDPSNPPLTRGKIVASGTPTNKWPLIVRLHVTKSGKAVDTISETFTANPSTNELTISSDDWAVDDTVRFTSTGTLPTPLQVGTDYTISSRDGDNITLTLGESSVDIEDSGSGTHTIITQSEGRYKLELEPFMDSGINEEEVTYSSTSLTNPASYTESYFTPVYQLTPGIDINGNLMDTVDPDIHIPEIHYGSFREGDYIYGLSPDSSGSGLYIHKWRFGTVETSEVIHTVSTTVTHHGDSSHDMMQAIRAKGSYSNNVYIATREGLYVFDIVNETEPTKLSISGVIDEDFRDVTFDPVTEMLWTGHSMGLCKINLATNTATQYISDNGGALDGIGENAYSNPGGLTAYDGVVLCAPCGDDDNYNFFFIYDDNVNGYYYENNIDDYFHGGYIDETDGAIIIRIGNDWVTYEVSDITGNNTGTLTKIEEYTMPTGSGSPSSQGTTITKIAKDTFMATVAVKIGYNESQKLEMYKRGEGVQEMIGAGWGLYRPWLTPSPYQHTGIPRSLIDLSEDGSGLYAVSTGKAFFKTIPGIPIPYGWNGSEWSNESSSDRVIAKTGTHDLGHGVEVSFSNAVGETWDTQFVLDEHITFMIAATPIKDNLQTYSFRGRYYWVESRRVEDWNTTVSGTSLSIPESSDEDFRQLDTEEVVISVKDSTADTYLTYVVGESPEVGASPSAGEFSAQTDGTLLFNEAEDGHSISVSYNYTLYS